MRNNKKHDITKNSIRNVSSSPKQHKNFQPTRYIIASKQKYSRTRQVLQMLVTHENLIPSKQIRFDIKVTF